MRVRHRKYLNRLLVSVLAALLATAGLNWIVDPHHAYRCWNISSLADYRRHQYVYSAEKFHHERPGVVIVGSSRVADGIRATARNPRGQPVSKIAIRGTSWYEQRHVLRHLIHHRHAPLEILFCLDLDMILNKRRPSDFEQSRFNAELNPVDYHAQNLISLHSIKQSWQLIRAQAIDQPIDPRIEDLVVKHGSNQIFHASLDRHVSMHTPAAAMRKLSPAIDELGSLMDSAHDRGIRFSILLLPTHVLAYEKLLDAGYREYVAVLKRRLAGTCQSRAVALWDFSGYTRWNMEPVPDADSKISMTWFYDCDHFTPALGDLVLQRVFGVPTCDDFPRECGIRLTLDTIDTRLGPDYRRQHQTHMADPKALMTLPRTNTVAPKLPASTGVFL